MKATLTKTQEAHPTGTYKTTTIDQRKAEADFLLLQTSPNVIQWRKGLMGAKRETISNKTLKDIQEIHPNWMTDF
jgi:hypothetical protein